METRHLLPWLNLMVTEPFYLFHFLAFFSYFVVRSSAVQILAPDFPQRLLRKEIQAILAFSTYAIVKVVKAETWESFIGDVLFVAKGFILAVAFFLDYHLALCYSIGFLAIHILTQQPPCHELVSTNRATDMGWKDYLVLVLAVTEGTGDSTQLTPLQLETLLTEGNTSRFWLVEFRASFSVACIRLSRVFTDLSVTYSNKHLSFGIVDLGHFPNAAEKFGISMDVSMAQLPVYILFENAVEVSRYPNIGMEAKGSGVKVSKRILCQHFELDRLLLDYVFSK